MVSFIYTILKPLLTILGAIAKEKEAVHNSLTLTSLLSQKSTLPNTQVIGVLRYCLYKGDTLGSIKLATVLGIKLLLFVILAVINIVQCPYC
jgi:hypothetical protein